MITGQRFPTEQSSFFSFIEAERKEIEKVRWLESERIGMDCQHDRAIWIWITRHRDAWRRGLRESGLY